ncbi:MAG: M56 family metallopeptidase [Oscillospiraceae bacterium]
MESSLLLKTLETSLFSACFICVILLLSKAISKRYSAKLKYWIWLAVFIRLVIPALPTMQGAPITFTAPVSLGAPPAYAQVQTGGAEDTGTSDAKSVSPGIPAAAEADDYGSAPDTDTQPALQAPALSTAGIAAIIWLSGAAIYLLFNLSGYFIFILRIRRGRTAVTPLIAETLSRLAPEMKIRRVPRIYFCGGVKSPMMTGFFSPVILLPERAYTETGLEMILRHELVHLKRRDLWYKLLLLLASSVHWFNPIVLLAAKRAAFDMELACDEAVLQNASMDYRVEYGRAMLDIMQSGLRRRTPLTTHFSADKKSIVRRFSKVLDTGIKRRGLPLLFTAVLLIASLGVLVGWKTVDTDGNTGASGFEPGTVYSRSSGFEQVAAYDAGNSYSIDGNGNVIISYHNGETTAAAPFTVTAEGDDSYAEPYPGAYISADKTVFACGGQYGDTPLMIYVSDDMGKTWYTSEINLDGTGVSWTSIGFTSEEDGWLVIANFHAMTYEDNYIFQTSDGGKSWAEVQGDQNDVYPSVLTGSGFSDDGTGFLCFWYYEKDFEPPVIRTQDGGKTWEKLDIPLPQEFDSYNKTALSPVFDGANGTMPVLLSSGGADGIVGTVYLTSTDCGRTWNFDKYQSMAQIWAYAWQTREGKPRFDMMSEAMQADFTALRGGTDSYVIRWSSPWVEDFDVAMVGDEAEITYWYADSSGSKYKGTERLTFGEENGRAVVTGCRTEIDLMEYARVIPLYYTVTDTLKMEKLPVLDETRVSEVLFTGTTGEGITQVLYRWDENTVNDVGIFSYIVLNGVKYDLGYVGYGDAGGSLGEKMLTRTGITADSPVYSLIKSYGTSYVAGNYYTVRENVPYFLHEITGTAAETDFDGDGQADTVSQYYGGAPYHEFVIYQWDIAAGTVRSEKLTGLFGCETVDYNEAAGLFYAYNYEKDSSGNIAGRGVPTVFSFKNGVFTMETDPAEDSIKYAFVDSVSYDPGRNLLSFTIPESVPDGFEFYLHVAGRLFMGDAGGGMSFHAFDEESENSAWVPGKTYTCALDSEGLDYCLLDFGLLNDRGERHIYKITVSPDGSKLVGNAD